MGPKREEEKIQFYNEQLIAIINQIKKDMGSFSTLNDSKREVFFNNIQELDQISKESKLLIKRLKRLNEKPVEIVSISDELKKDIERIKKSIQDEHRLRYQK